MDHQLFARQSGNGSHRGGGSNSLSGIISTLVPTFIIAAVAFTVFLIARSRFSRVYGPRTLDYVVHHEERRTPTWQKAGGLFKIWKTLPDDFVLRSNSLDGYLFLRFFKLLIFICLAGCVVTWPVLFPVNITGGGGQQQLDMLTFSNVRNGNRYYAHAVVSWVFLGGVTIAIAHERLFFAGARQAYFLSPLRARRLTSRTLLFLSIPKQYRSEQALREMLGTSVRRIWMVTDCKKLEKKVKLRDKAATKLEATETKLITGAHKEQLKDGGKEHADVRKYLDNQKRPKHRLRFLIGKKADTIDWARQEIPKLNEKIRSEQMSKLRGEDVVGAAFVEFDSQYSAQKALQLAAPSKKKQFQPRFIDVQPEEVIFKNLKRSWATRKLGFIVGGVAVTLITIFWTPITAFVGALANINYLTNKVPFLGFINSIPPVILGVVTGLLPTIILAVCVILVPIICRQLAKLAGAATLSEVELKTQSWYFIFQVIQVFLVTTFASGAAAVTTQIINNPGSAPALLANNLPKASNFYISYFILFGLLQAALQVLLIVPLLLKTILGKILDKTPRKQYTRWTSLAGLGWGSEYPKWTNLGVIALSYSCIAPLILGFATIGFTLLYLAFRHNWLFVFGNSIDMKGEAYAKALRQLTTGVYLSTICMIGLLAISTSNTTSSAGPLALMVVFLVVLIVFNFLFDRAVGPLEKFLPLDLLEHNVASVWSPHLPSRSGQTLQTEKYSANGQLDPEAQITAPQHKPDIVAKENPLTRRVRPIIHKRFFSPLSNSVSIVDSYAKIKEDIEDEKTAYLNPVMKAEDPLIWLPRDGVGVSQVLIRGNEEKGVRSTDQFAWLDGKSKVVWDTGRAQAVRAMLVMSKSSERNDNDYATAGGTGGAQMQ